MSQVRRAGYRVSVKPSSGVTASMSLVDRRWKVTPGNISQEGLFVRLQPDAPVSLAVDMPVVVDLTYGDTTLRLHGMIRARRAGGNGIFFAHRTDDGYVNPVGRLGQICAALQVDELCRRLVRRPGFLRLRRRKELTPLPLRCCTRRAPEGDPASVAPCCRRHCA